MRPVPETNLEKDIPNKRKFPLDNGNKVVLENDTNPYGMWSVRFEKGQVPKELSGMFTSYEQAVTAFEKYLNTKNAKRYTQVNPEEEIKVKAKTTKKKEKLFD